MSCAELIIAVHPAFAALVNWPALVQGSERWVVITTEASLADLERTGRSGKLHEVIVLDAFDTDTLAGAISELLDAAGDRARVRLGSMLEPLQLPAAELRARFGIPGPTPDQVRPFVDKVVMKESMRAVDDLLPRFIALSGQEKQDPSGWAHHIAKRLQLPVFAKPRASNSCSGTAFLDSVDALTEFLSKAHDDYELDEFIAGNVFHLDSVIFEGKIVWFGAGQYLVPPYRALRGEPLAGIVIGPDDGLYEELRALNTRLLAAFPFVPDGCMHLEAIRREDGAWMFLEAAARTPGWRIPEMHQIHRGIDLRHAHYSILAGKLPVLPTKTGPAAGYYCPLKTRAGRIDTLHAPRFDSPHELTWFPAWKQRDDAVSAATMSDFLGAVVLWNGDRALLLRDLQRLRSFVPYSIA